METTKKVGLSSPWVIFWREIEAMFKEDPEIKTQYDEAANEVKLFVDNSEKADALMKLLPTEKTFGNVTLKITVIPADVQATSRVDIFEQAFKGNGAFVGTAKGPAIFDKMAYVIFKPEVVQFFNDDLTDAHGYCSTLYQDIAKDIFGESADVYFCTDLIR